jgi:proprotein convertase subtilisin/kexin type 5
MCFDQCLTGQYADYTTNICMLCDPSCMDCVGPANSDCLTCSPTTLRIWSMGYCQCFSQGIYESGTLICGTCSYNCFYCDTISTNCTLCMPMSNRIFNSYACPCDLGYIDVGASICAICTSVITGCITCLSSTVCSVCSTIDNFQLTATNIC